MTKMIAWARGAIDQAVEVEVDPEFDRDNEEHIKSLMQAAASRLRCSVGQVSYCAPSQTTVLGVRLTGRY